MNSLAILGASGHGKVIADIALTSQDWNSVAFFDDSWPATSQNGKYPVVGNSLHISSTKNVEYVVVGIGNNAVRLKKQLELEHSGLKIATLVHKSAIVSCEAEIGAGTVVMPGAVINAGASIGQACIINTNATVEHDCVLGDGVHISPGAALAGGVKVGDVSWIGLGASVIQMLQIGSKVTVGAGAVVIQNLPDGVTVAGVPAKVKSVLE